jgi:hypothetical protein
MLTKKLICSATSLLLAYHPVCKAQDAHKLELSIVPALGFNLSMPVLAPQSSRDNFTYTLGTAVPKDFFMGIGVQAQLLDEWQATLRIATTGYGYAYRYQYPLSSPGSKTKGNSQASTTINTLDFTTERKIGSTGTMRLLNQNFKVTFQALVGIRYASVHRLDRVDTLEALPSGFITGLMEERDSIRNIRYGSGAISVGLNAQLYINAHRSVKIGAMYSYAPNPLLEFRTNVTYYAGGVVNNDQFKMNSGMHQLLFYFEYPIRFLKWKKQ